jgi:hypothetical protein
MQQAGRRQEFVQATADGVAEVTIGDHVRGLLGPARGVGTQNSRPSPGGLEVLIQLERWSVGTRVTGYQCAERDVVVLNQP